jgi:hypothetical protein
MALIVYDSFDRANNTTSLGIADTGQEWQILSGSFGIWNNLAYRPIRTATSLAIIESGNSNVEVEVEQIYLGGFRNGGLVFRASDESNFLHFRWTSEGNSLQIYKFENNVATLILQKSMPAYEYNIPQNFKIIADGENIDCYVNGAREFSIAETFNQNATKHGIRMQSDGDMNWNNFAVRNLTPNIVSTGSPIVSIESVSRTKISDEEGMNQSIIKVKFDRSVQAYKAMLNGVSHSTGVIVHNGSYALTNEVVDIIIDWNELSSEGENKINIYGQSGDGTWTGQEDIVVISTSKYGTSRYGKKE